MHRPYTLEHVEKLRKAHALIILLSSQSGNVIYAGILGNLEEVAEFLESDILGGQFYEQST